MAMLNTKTVARLKEATKDLPCNVNEQTRVNHLLDMAEDGVMPVTVMPVTENGISDVSLAILKRYRESEEEGIDNLIANMEKDIRRLEKRYGAELYLSKASS